MAIIENAKYNSLPEQVEENKENIKKLEEAIAEIDPDAITAVINQVATNTSDISNIKAEQITQNNNIGLNALAITSEATNRKALIDVDASGDTQVKAQAGKDIDLYSSDKIHLYGDEGANLSDDYGDEVAVIKDNVILETTSHNVILNEDGTLKMDDNKIGENGHLTFENIYDKDGHNRFLEGTCDIITPITGLTYTYLKWSLSGSHLMIVAGGTIEQGTVLPNTYIVLLNIALPSWIINKIQTIVDVYVNSNNITFRAANNYFSTQNKLCALIKTLGNTIQLILPSTASLTISNDSVFRIQFDLLIDNE